MSDWKPIETAPKDGSFVLVAGGGVGDDVTLAKWSLRVGAWDCNEFMLEDWDHQAEGYSRPTHWMPLPPPPTTIG